MSAPPVPDLRAAAQRADQRRDRSQQVELGPSGVGECHRRAAYIITQTPPSDIIPPSMQMILGTWIHTGALAAAESELGALTEVKVQSELLKGSADMLLAGVIEDLKTTSVYSFGFRLNRGAPVPHLYQTHIYGWHLLTGQFGEETRTRLAAAGLLRGDGTVDVEWIRLRYWSRDDGDEWVHQQEYDPAITAEALAWLAEVYEAIERGGPEAASRDLDGPGLSVICDQCPFATACWGVPARPDAPVQANLITGRPDVEQALADYHRFRELESAARAGKALARAKLDSSEAGQYGDFVLGWTGGKAPPAGKVGPPDLPAIEALFAAAGIEMPRIPTKPSSRSINVTPARTPAVGTVTPIDLNVYVPS